MNEIYTNPNQRIVTVVRAKKKGDRNNYSIITRQAARIAIRLLDDGTASFMLYVHFALHKDTYCFAFSPAALHKELGISKDRCRTAFAKLIDAGFLVQKAPQSNQYIFYELPQQYENIPFDVTNYEERADIANDIPICPSIAISMSTPIDTALDGERDVCPEPEGYPDGNREDISADGDRNITDITQDNTVNITENTKIICESKDEVACSEVQNRIVSVLDRFSYDKILVDENDEIDAEQVNALFFIPEQVRNRNSSSDYSDELPF